MSVGCLSSNRSATQVGTKSCQTLHPVVTVSASVFLNYGPGPRSDEPAKVEKRLDVRAIPCGDQRCPGVSKSLEIRSRNRLVLVGN